MALYAKLALRNVFRNRRRTLITLAAMGFGAAAIIVFGGFVHSIYYGVRESTIRSQVGHIQMYRKGYSEKGNLAPFDYLIADYPALRDELRRLPHVKTVTARLGFSGLVSTGDTTTAFVGSGVVPEGELDLSDNTARVRESLERLIRDRGLDLEIKTWEDLALRYHQVRELFGRIFAVLTLIVSIMVVFGITNTMTMAIFERTREIGTVMALGTRRRARRGPRQGHLRRRDPAPAAAGLHARLHGPDLRRPRGAGAGVPALDRRGHAGLALSRLARRAPGRRGGPPACVGARRARRD